LEKCISIHEDLFNFVVFLCRFSSSSFVFLYQKYHSKIIPKLTFELDEQDLYVCNNEIGFNDEDVRALCNVGDSTKGSGGGAYIGQKGIGFKSVFSVSNEPAIHSNGYHFKLDLEHKVIPYQIESDDIPDWIKTKTYPNNYNYNNNNTTTTMPSNQITNVKNKKHIPPSHSQSHSQSETCICLPLNETMKNKLQYLSTKLDDISPMLLLFLNKLRRLTIIDSIHESKREMERIDHKQGIVELKSNDSSKKFIVIKKTLHVPLEVARNKNYLSTEIAIAFALPNDQDSDQNNDQDSDRNNKRNNTPMKDQISLSNFPVFSYLPVQAYGFRFILQGDFILASGRESIRSDVMWNKFLSTKLPDMFLEAIHLAKQSDSPLNIQLVLDALPIEHEVMSFFKASTKEVMRCVKGVACLPTSTQQYSSSPSFSSSVSLDHGNHHPNGQLLHSNEKKLEWALPSQIILASELDQEYIPASLVQTYLHKYYLDPVHYTYINYCIHVHAISGRTSTYLFLFLFLNVFSPLLFEVIIRTTLQFIPIFISL